MSENRTLLLDSAAALFDDLAGLDAQADVMQHFLGAVADADMVGGDQAHAASRQFGQRPSASMVERST